MRDDNEGFGDHGADHEIRLWFLRVGNVLKCHAYEVPQNAPAESAGVGNDKVAEYLGQFGGCFNHVVDEFNRVIGFCGTIFDLEEESKHLLDGCDNVVVDELLYHVALGPSREDLDQLMRQINHGPSWRVLPSCDWDTVYRLENGDLALETMGSPYVWADRSTGIIQTLAFTQAVFARSVEVVKRW